MLIYHFGDSKVRYFYISLMEQDIFWFYIPVYYFLVFHVLEGHCDLCYIFFKHLIWETFFMKNYLILQGPSIAKF